MRMAPAGAGARSLGAARHVLADKPLDVACQVFLSTEHLLNTTFS